MAGFSPEKSGQQFHENNHAQQRAENQKHRQPNAPLDRNG